MKLPKNAYPYVHAFVVDRVKAKIAEEIKNQHNEGLFIYFLKIRRIMHMGL
jgi:hypothetical protein